MYGITADQSSLRLLIINTYYQLLVPGVFFSYVCIYMVLYVQPSLEAFHKLGGGGGRGVKMGETGEGREGR